MRTEERKETKTIEVVTNIYIAEDGKEFESQQLCEKHEKALAKEKQFGQIKPYLLDFDGVPIHDSSEFSEMSEYRYFKVPNSAVLKMISEYYDGQVCTRQDLPYPTIVCIEETYDYGYLNGDVYDYYLDQMIGVTQKFYKNLGIEVEFKKEA